MIIKGFKVGCNQAYRELQPFLAASSSLQQQQGASLLQQQGASMLQQPGSSMLQQCCSKGDSDKGDSKGDSGKGDSGKGNSKGDSDKGNSKGNSKGASLLPCGYLFARGYNDHILEGAGELDRWFAYLRDNPRRLALKRAYPDFFRVRFGITIGGQTYAAIGNRFLLSYPQKLQVQCSRRLTDEEIQATTAALLQRARQGFVLVSPAISKGEQAVMRAALDARLPLIFLTPWGFNAFSKPGHQYYEACAEGRFLILAPWPHENQRIPLTRQMCLQLNTMAEEICRG
jgi:hypothetical protein